jgi:hypothetical protein
MLAIKIIGPAHQVFALLDLAAADHGEKTIAEIIAQHKGV